VYRAMRVYATINQCLAGALWILFFATWVDAQTAKRPDAYDTQVWPEIQISVPLNNRVELTALGQIRASGNASALVDERIGPGIAIKPNGWITISPFYLYIATQPPGQAKGIENRLSIATTVRLPATKRFTIINRFLFERRIRNPKDSMRYRQRLQIEHSLGANATRWRAYISDEIFYDWNYGEWIRNRFAAGVIRMLSANLSCDVYYMRQSDGRTLPGNVNVIGAIFRARL
jgi:hypothetical protein